MSDRMEITLEGDGHLVDAPLVDMLYTDPAEDCFVVTIVPSDDVSADAKLTIRISKLDPEGRRIAILLARIADLCGGSVHVVSHLGGANFTLQLADNRTVTLEQLANSVVVEVFDRLKQIAFAAELSYRVGHTIGV